MSFITGYSDMRRLAIAATACALATGTPPALAQDYVDLRDSMEESMDEAQAAKDRVNRLADSADDAEYCAAVKSVSDNFWAAIIAADELHDNLKDDDEDDEADALADLIRVMIDEANEADGIHERNC